MKDRAKLASYIWSMVRDEHLVEDVLQDVYVLAISKISEINDEQHLRYWSRHTARFLCLKALRDRRRMPISLSSETQNLLEGVWAELDKRETTDSVDALRSCIDVLTPRSKKMIRMRYVDGCKSAEIAKRLGQQVQSVYVSLSRIHRSLSECVKSHVMRKISENQACKPHGEDSQ